MARARARGEGDRALVSPRDWEELVELRMREYTLSTADVCRLLSCSRDFVGRYVKPNVRHLYVQAGFPTTDDNGDVRAGRDGRKATAIPWSKVLALTVARRLGEEGGAVEAASLWFSAPGFAEAVRSHEVVEARTRVVPLLDYMTPEGERAWRRAEEDFAEREREIDRRMAEAAGLGPWAFLGPMMQEAALRREREEKLLACLDEDGLALARARVSSGKRTDAPFVRLDGPLPPPRAEEDWQTVSDMRGYAGTNEQVARACFDRGMLRVTLALPDAAGRVGRKVYWVPDPSARPVPDSMIPAVVAYGAWARVRR